MNFSANDGNPVRVAKTLTESLGKSSIAKAILVINTTVVKKTSVISASRCGVPITRCDMIHSLKMRHSAMK